MGLLEQTKEKGSAWTKWSYLLDEGKPFSQLKEAEDCLSPSQGNDGGFKRSGIPAEQTEETSLKDKYRTKIAFPFANLKQPLTRMMMVKLKISKNED